MLIIRMRGDYENERKYIIDTILGHFWGIEYSIIHEDRRDICIQCSNDSGAKHIILPDTFFSTPDTKWLKAESMPQRPLKLWDLEGSPFSDVVSQSSIPVIYGEADVPGRFIEFAPTHIHLKVDIFGSAFFMLTRYEECVTAKRDEHGRFRLKDSVAYAENFVSRPIINEYIEILWWCMHQIWPGLKRKHRAFRVIPTHDVDIPFLFTLSSPMRIARSCIAEFIRKPDCRKLAERFYQVLNVKTGAIEKDPYFTFSQIMDFSEAQNVRSEFYFMSDHIVWHDSIPYPIDHPSIMKLMREIHDRGHKLGFHPSYTTLFDENRLKQEWEKLLAVIQSLGIEQSAWGGRHHFLRTQMPWSWQAWHDIGMDYDSSLGFPDCAGFRAGICYEYSTFNLMTGSRINFIERPLLAMECSLVDSRYMGLNYDQARTELIRLKHLCKKYNGDYVILWHNNRFENPAEAELYRAALQAEG